jgi:OOP family OmpA-OmpF porin
MKNKLQISGVITSVAAGMLFTSTVIAHTAGKTNDSYVGSIGHHYITDGSGNCVRTGAWKAADKTADCGAAVKAMARPAPAPPAEPAYETVTLSAGALFDTNSDAIKPAGKQQLDDVASKIGGTARVSDIKIVGHTDSIGSAAYNQQLSVRRATAVRDYLAGKGVNAGLMSVSGMGESSPVGDNTTKEGRASNRRVEVSIGVTQQAR